MFGIAVFLATWGYLFCSKSKVITSCLPFNLEDVMQSSVPYNTPLQIPSWPPKYATFFPLPFTLSIRYVGYILPLLYLLR